MPSVPDPRPLDNHRSTIASVCDETYVTGKNGHTSKMPLIFLLKPQDGITKKLMKMVEGLETHPTALKTFTEGLKRELTKKFNVLLRMLSYWLEEVVSALYFRRMHSMY
jgi:hypothetical protein